MKSSLNNICLLALLVIVGTPAALATHPEKLIVKAEKLAGKNWGEFKVIKVPVDIDPAQPYYIQSDTLFRLNQHNGELLGYLVVSSATGRFEKFDYMVVYKEDMSIVDIKILVYRSEHGYQVSTKGWIKQFLNHPGEKVYVYGQNIDAISGATISGKSLTDNINRLNLLISSLKK